MPDASLVTIGAQQSKAFYIVVPPITDDDITIRVQTTEGHASITKSHFSVDQNTIATIPVSVQNLQAGVHANLVWGSEINSAIPNDVTSVVFEYNDYWYTGTLLSTSDSPQPIYCRCHYASPYERVMHVCTPADTIYASSDCSKMFYEKNHLTSINFGNTFVTSRTKNMAKMFQGCSGLTSLDLSCFNTANVENMEYLFWACGKLTSLDLSHFNTAKVTKMTYMFYFCTRLKSFDLSSFNTAKVQWMDGMFWGCHNLTSLDLSSFNTSKVTDMMYMFSNCSRLTNLNLSNFDMNNVRYKLWMCDELSVTSGRCTITCPESVQEELQDGTSLPTSGVTFTWVRP